MNKKDILFFNKKLKYTGSICRRIVKCLNIVQLEILRPTFKDIYIYYGFSLLHIFALVLQPWMSAYIRKTDGVYISVPKND